MTQPPPPAPPPAQSPPASIRARLTRSLLLYLALVLLAAGAAFSLFVRFALIAQFDAALLARAHAAAADIALESTPQGDRLDFGIAAEPARPGSPAQEFFQVWSLGPAGASPPALERPGTLAGADIRPPAADHLNHASNILLPDGRPARLLWLRFTPKAEHPDPEDPTDDLPSPPTGPIPTLLLAVARPREALDAVLHILHLGLLGLGALLAVGAIVAVRTATHSGLAPIRGLASAVAALNPDNLPEQLDLPPLPREIDPVRQRLGDLISRLRSAIARERRFSGAAAHELRTPLAELRSLLDVRLRWPQDIDACTASLREAREVTTRMEHLVEALLSLARAQAPLTEPPPHPLDPAPLLRPIAARHAQSAANQGLTLSHTIPDGLTCLAHPALLAAIADNLLSNAVEYSPPGAEITFTLRPRDDAPGAVLEVANGPTNLAESDLPHLFEPFWRKDAARSSVGDADHHLGLGLSLAAALAARMGAHLLADLQPQGRLAVRLVLSAPAPAIPS